MLRLRSGAVVALLAVSGLSAVAAPANAVAAPAHADARWAIVPSANRGPGINVLDAVACGRHDACQAVGYSYDASRGAYRTLIESEKRARWSIVSSPNRGTGDNELSGVSCGSATACTAVGFYDVGGTHRTLVESWSRAGWSLVPSPDVGTVNNVLDSVACVSPRSCQAVGYSYDSTIAVQSPLIESWNGINWSIVPSPSVGSGANLLSAVSCASSRSCEAVGYTISATTGSTRTLIESWNGTTWSIVASPNAGTIGDYLLSVSCASRRACVAVGEYSDSSVGNYQTLIEAWDGVHWSIVASSDIGTNVNDLLGVSCPSADSCRAVGLYFDTDLGSYQTLTETWNGATWSVLTSPNVGTSYNVLATVDCRSGRRRCVAAGNYLNAAENTYQTLTEVSR